MIKITCNVYFEATANRTRSGVVCADVLCVQEAPQNNISFTKEAIGSHPSIHHHSSTYLPILSYHTIGHRQLFLFIDELAWNTLGLAARPQSREDEVACCCSPALSQAGLRSLKGVSLGECGSNTG